MAVVALLGSARPDGDAARLLDAVARDRDALRLDLGALHIRDYAYGRPAGDDFLGVARQIADADGVLLVTPVYWYTMSGVLKRFLDRMTDLVTVEKSLGRRLAGRGLYVAACGSEDSLPDGFEVPFRRTAAYFDMTYGGTAYAQRSRLGDAETAQRLQMFGEVMGAYRAV